MKLKRYQKLIAGILLLIMMLSLGACSTPPKDNEQTAPLVFADAQWDSIRFHNAVAMFVLDKAWGIASEEVAGTTQITWEALMGDGVDIYMEVWSENFSFYEEDLQKGVVLELSTNFNDNYQGFYVPTYVIEGDAARGIEAVAPDLRTVKDLVNHPQVFTDPEDKTKGVIYGAIPGWEIDEIMRNKYVAYGLDVMYNYQNPGSTAALDASFVSAYEAGIPWVGYSWEPTWVSGKYDMTLLQDEPYQEELLLQGLCEVLPNNVTICAKKTVCDQYPEIKAFLSNYKTSSALTAAALAYINDSGATYEEAAKWFITENPDLFKAWLQEEDYNKVIEAIG